MTGAPRVVVAGGGLAGLTAALACADGGAEVTLVERRRRLGGLTWSFEHAGRWIDNGQHVFLRCCDAYLGFLRRIGSDGDVELQDRLDVTVLRPDPAGGAPVAARLRRSALPAPLQLGGALLRYRHLGAADRLRIGRAALPLRSVDLRDPALDRETFAAYLRRHGQGDRAIETMWDLITVATINLPASEASAAMGAKVFQTGLLRESGAADIGWSRIPLGRLHGERAARALEAAGVEVALGERVLDIGGGNDPAGGLTVRTEGRTFAADAVIVALPHHTVNEILPPDSFPTQAAIGAVGHSPIVNVHVTFDRPVTDLALFAGIDSPAQWVFDRTVSSGLEPAVAGARSVGNRSANVRSNVRSAAVRSADVRSADGAGPASAAGRRQYLAVSISAAGDRLGRRPEELATEVVAALRALLPAARDAGVVDTLVTRERTATFRAAPGTAALRPGPRTRTPGLYLAGAWTDTGWPATMEGAVRSGQSAARAVLLAAGSTRRLPEEVA